MPTASVATERQVVILVADVLSNEEIADTSWSARPQSRPT
jgi:hypothetical protein